MMKAGLLAVAAMALLAGCASDLAVIRVVEYKAGSMIAAVSGTGIAVHQSGAAHAFADVRIIYQGERGVVTIAPRSRDAAPEPEPEPQPGKGG